MKTSLIAGVLATLAFVSTGLAQDRPTCGVPGYFLFGDSHLKRVAGSVTTIPSSP